MKRFLHNLSHQRLLSGNPGYCIPVACYPVLPGDSIQQATSLFMRVTPLNTPVMHRVDARIHHFYVPHRLVWEDFEDFITGGPDGNNASVHPTINAQNDGVCGLLDYLGIPPVTTALFVNALPIRAYQLVWNKYFRDQDFGTEAVVSLASGVDTTTAKTLQRICWEKDYLTSSRATPQKGDAVTVPLGDTAPIIRNPASTNESLIRVSATGALALGVNTFQSNGSGEFESNGGAAGLNIDPNGTMLADLSGATSSDVTALRLAFALQRYKEARSQFGSNYVDYLAYLGIRSSDARLQRPEYLGGGKETIQFSEVLQTAPALDEDSLGVGNLKGHGMGVMRSNRYRRFYEEHGTVISILSVRPKTIYVQALNRMWSPVTKEDYFQKELEHIGQQEVLNKEAYAPHASPNGVFGYQDRYDELRRIESSVHGEFRTTLLDMWHYGRIFPSAPALNNAFVTCDPTDRVYQVGEDVANSLWLLVNNSIQARRQVSTMAKSFIF